MSDLLAIGEALIELNQPGEGAPFVQGFGGDTSNAMIAAARLGADAAYFTAVGADAFGQALTELWLKEGVDASRIVVNGGAHTGLYFVTHGPKGHAFSYMRAGSAASRIGESDLPVDRIRATKILHASGVSQAISSSAADAVFAAIDAAHDAKRLISYDPNLRLKLWPLRRARAIIHEAMGLCDIALPGLDDGLALTTLEKPDAIVDFYLRLGARVVVLKLGKAGAIAATAKKRERIDGRAVAAIDATGAGDCFDGAFLAEFVRHGDPFAAARFANVAAALSTLGYGAVAPLPRRADVEAAMEDAGGRQGRPASRPHERG
jgi:2-dehydro-3-deoxygluconokinase